MNPVTAWVKPPEEITGRDHLGARVPCETLYAKLIPGITNVTNRARYYSFYPWLIWALGRRYKSVSSSEFIEKLRRADCLFTLIGAWHGGGPEEDWRHGGELVGRRALLGVLNELKEGKACRLSNYTRLKDSPERYFKNRLGGLGQYYFGSLRELGILEGDAKPLVKYTKERGGVLAAAFDEGVSLKKFFDAIDGDTVTVSTLKSLKAFCPCGLTSNAKERHALLDMFFNRPGAFFDEGGQSRRRQTLALLLDFIAHIEELPGRSDLEIADEGLFRAGVYTGALPGGKAWAPPEALEPIRQGWMVYQRNELLSVALQGIFWAALAELEEQGGIIESRQAFRDWFFSTFAKEAVGSIGKETYATAVDHAKKRMPSLADWMNESHEIQLAWTLVGDAPRAVDKNDRANIVRLGVEILLSLAARGANGADPYGGFINAGELTDYPINLFTFHKLSHGEWLEMRLANLPGWLATDWGLDVHFRVALRKLRAEGKDTFRIRPTEEGLEMIGAPLPEFSNPRLRQAYRILCDLGAMERDTESELLILTDLGRSLLEESRG